MRGNEATERRSEMTINDLIEQLQRLPMKDRPIYIERFERSAQWGLSTHPCHLEAAIDEGPHAVIRPRDRWMARD